MCDLVIQLLSYLHTYLRTNRFREKEIDHHSTLYIFFLFLIINQITLLETVFMKNNHLQTDNLADFWSRNSRIFSQLYLWIFGCIGVCVDNKSDLCPPFPPIYRLVQNQIFSPRGSTILQIRIRQHCIFFVYFPKFCRFLSAIICLKITNCIQGS